MLAVNPPQAPRPRAVAFPLNCSALIAGRRRPARLDRQVAVAEMTGRNGAAVGATLEYRARQRHDHARIGLVAARKTDERVEMIAARDQLDGSAIAAADERAFHSLRAHADAVGSTPC